jgi:hypothetical protein
MEENLIKKVKLENGLDMKFYDSSKKIAGDRWQVKMVVKIEIPVSDYLKDIEADLDADEVLKTLGQSIVYEKSMERNFIDNKDKVLNDFCDSFFKSSSPYLSVPNFPAQFIVTKYGEKKSAKFR